MTTNRPSECFIAQTIPGFFGDTAINPDVGGFAVAASSKWSFYLDSFHFASLNDIVDIVINLAVRELQSIRIRFQDRVLT